MSRDTAHRGRFAELERALHSVITAPARSFSLNERERAELVIYPE